jgi:hypothetical protein
MHKLIFILLRSNSFLLMFLSFLLSGTVYDEYYYYDR